MKISASEYKKRFAMFIIFNILITTLLWILGLKHLEYSFANTDIALRNISLLIALLAIVFLSFNFVFAARLKFLQKVFGGQDKIYRFHIFLGISSYFLVLLHPFLLAARYFDDLTFFRSFYIYSSLNDLGKNLGITAFWLLTALVLITGQRRLPYNIWKHTHRFMGLPLLLGGLHGLLQDHLFANYLPMKVWIGFWVILGLTCYIYKTFLFNIVGPLRKYKVVKIDHLKDVTSVYMKPYGKSVKHEAGQFAFFKFKQKGIRESHPYTISSAPNSDLLRVSMKGLGDWSKNIGKDLVEGTDVNVYGPYGQFTQENLRNSKKQVWIAGGIGITPFLSMLRDLKNKNIKNEIYLICSTKTEEECIFREEILKDLDKTNVKVDLHISSVSGYLDLDYVKKFVGNFDDAVFLLCGPMPMTDGIKKSLKSNGVHNNDIVFELFNFK
jgi:predicted ferric reductase